MGVTSTDASAAYDAAERLAGARAMVAEAAVLMGLAGVAITQPLLDLFGNNPTFFVAGPYGRRQIVVFALVIALVPAALVFAATTAARLFGVRAHAAAHTIGVLLLATLFGMVLARSLGIDAVAPALVLALGLGTGVALAERRLAPARTFLRYLALGNIGFVLLFVLASPTGDLLAGDFDADAGGARVRALGGPVVVLVLDEFPLAAIVRPDGTINEVRYPNLAHLAEESTWFRNAASENATTFTSVPEILTGSLSAKEDLPTLQDHPNNVFTLFGSRYPVHRYEPVTDLCPPDTCERPPAGPLRQALSDASIVYGHRMLPAAVRDSLPAIDQGWGDFGDELTVAPAPADSDPMGRLDDLPASARKRSGQAAALRASLPMIGSEPSIHVVHVLLPHHPYNLTPWGVTSSSTWVPKDLPIEGEPGHERAFAQVYALQAMQIAAIDQMIGELVERMKATGAWEGATLVVTSDHGVDITPPHFTRRLDVGDDDLVLRIPLFIKAPGQTEGEVRDEPASTLDVVPSLIDLLGIETDWELDGHSLFDGSEPTRQRTLTTTLDEGLVAFGRQQALHPGDDWASVLAIGPLGDLVGTSVADHAAGAQSPLRWSYDGAKDLADPEARRGRAPVLMSGLVEGGDAAPPDLVIALDGVISGTIGDYRSTDDGWAFTALLGPEVEGGAQAVVAYSVERRDDRVILHPLHS